MKLAMIQQVGIQEASERLASLTVVADNIDLMSSVAALRASLAPVHEAAELSFDAVEFIGRRLVSLHESEFRSDSPVWNNADFWLNMYLLTYWHRQIYRAVWDEEGVQAPEDKGEDELVAHGRLLENIKSLDSAAESLQQVMARVPNQGKWMVEQFRPRVDTLRSLTKFMVSRGKSGGLGWDDRLSQVSDCLASLNIWRPRSTEHDFYGGSFFWRAMYASVCYHYSLERISLRLSFGRPYVLQLCPVCGINRPADKLLANPYYPFSAAPKICAYCVAAQGLERYS